MEAIFASYAEALKNVREANEDVKKAEQKCELAEEQKKRELAEQKKRDLTEQKKRKLVQYKYMQLPICPSVYCASTYVCRSVCPCIQTLSGI